MSTGGPGWPRLALLAAVASAIAGAGLLTERTDPFPKLRFAVQQTRAELPSTIAVDRREVVVGLPILSVYLDTADLDHLLANKMEHGRDFERRASVTYFEDGVQRFSGAAGLRVHGGGSRLNSPRQSFRLFFRRRYGFTSMGRDVLFGPSSQPLQRLVVHNDVRRDGDGTDWWLVNPLGYDLARRVGAITPDTKPARFVLNGEDQGLYVLTEHFDDEYFDSHMPGRPISMELADMEALRERLDAMHPFTMEKVRREIDLDNMVTWFISVVFLATRDAYQGPGQFLDEATGLWFWVTWDVDQSLRNWDLESYYYLLNFPGESERGRRASEPRPLVVGKLIAEDAGFRDYLAARVDTMLNHQLTQAFLDGRRAHYEEVAEKFGVPEPGYQRHVAEFLDRRRAFVRSITEQWLNTPPGIAVAARGDGTGPLEVDGFRKDAPYEGVYFPGREVVLRAPEGPVSWYVNGEAAGTTTQLKVRADRPLSILARPASAAGKPAFAEPRQQREPVAPEPEAPPPAWRPVPSETGYRFELMETEVTVSQFRTFARASGLFMPRQPHWSGSDHPVVNLTWDEAAAFCRWAGGRLPTEAEWEAGARAGSRAAYPWGQEFDNSFANGARAEGPDLWLYTAPVKSFRPNALGLYDMIGNVWEWTSDPYEAPATPPGHLKTVRGGAWINQPRSLRVGVRLGFSRTGRHNLFMGVRCAR